MPSRYHPIAEGLWNDPKLEGTPFEEKAFFAFLCSNHRQRPSGIYRATDDQLSADTELPIKKVRQYLSDLSKRPLIVRDGAWIFVRNYLKRQPKQERLLIGAESDVKSCDSLPILKAFAEQYPVFSKWSTDRQETVGRPMNGFVPSEQLQSSTKSDAEQLQIESLVTVWNDATLRGKGNGIPGLVPCKVLTDSRAAKVRTRLKEEPDLSWWTEAIDRLARSKFARGGIAGKDGRTWRASFDWLIENDTNATKAYEGKYDDQKTV